MWTSQLFIPSMRILLQSWVLRTYLFFSDILFTYFGFGLCLFDGDVFKYFQVLVFFFFKYPGAFPIWQLDSLHCDDFPFFNL